MVSITNFANEDGRIDAEALGDASTAFRNDVIGPNLLGNISAAFRNNTVVDSPETPSNDNNSGSARQPTDCDNLPPGISRSDVPQCDDSGGGSTDDDGAPTGDPSGNSGNSDSGSGGSTDDDGAPTGDPSGSDGGSDNNQTMSYDSLADAQQAFRDGEITADQLGDFAADARDGDIPSGDSGSGGASGSGGPSRKLLLGLGAAAAVVGVMLRE